jgi:signal transduction histidine kinase
MDTRVETAQDDTFQKLVLAARRATAASLARGLAHEINNALTPIIGSAQMIALVHADNPETVDRANQIIEHARRIAAWTASFRHAASTGAGEATDFSLNGLVNEVVNLYAGRCARHGIALSAELDEAVPPVHGHPDQIEQVLMSLVQNSVDAGGAGTGISVTSAFDAAAGRVYVMVLDTGAGISSAGLERVFEPGFTTRAARGAGQGWGLFAAHAIVREHGGEIELLSPPPGLRLGTLARFWLPVVTED